MTCSHCNAWSKTWTEVDETVRFCPCCGVELRYASPELNDEEDEELMFRELPEVRRGKKPRYNNRRRSR